MGAALPLPNGAEDEDGAGLDAVVAAVRAASGADLTVAFAARPGRVWAPLAADPPCRLAPFRVGAALERAAATGEALDLADGALPTALALALPEDAATARVVACARHGNLAGGLLLLWSDAAVGARPEPVSAAVAPYLLGLLREREEAARRGRLRRRFEDLLASVPLGLVFVDARHEDCLVNRVAADLLGCEPGIVEPVRLSRAMAELRARAEILAGEGADGAADGRLSGVWRVGGEVLAVRSHPVLGDPRNGRVWIFEDVTEGHEAHRRLEDLAARLRETLVQAEAASTAKSAFLATMSHELRTPLTAVLGYASMIRDEMAGPVGPRDYLDYAAQIHDSGLHLLSLIDDILDMARIEAGRTDLHPERIDLPGLVRGCVTLAGRRSAEKGIRLSVSLDPELPPLVADARAVRQVLTNLLTNAGKYTRDGGAVELRAIPSPEGGVALEVADTGIGMTPEEIELALTPFGRVDSDLARREGGTGLGLPLVRSLVELHGGTLEIESAPGRGTTVRALFPRELALPT